MQVDLLWITAALLSSPLLTLCEPLYILQAPQIMRVGVQEKVFVEVQDYIGPNSLRADIRIKNFPSKDRDLGTSSVQLNSDNNYQALVDITISYLEDVFDMDKKQFVYIQATIDGRVMEKVVLVTFQLGYLFVQTDKTIYTPDTIVQYRVFGLGMDAKPTESTVAVEIVTPEGIIIQRNDYALIEGLTTKYFKLGNPISTGTWQIAASFRNGPYQNFTAEFEVKEYVLPSFEVKLEPEKSFFHINDASFSVDITAKYLFGQEVEGMAFAVFGVISNNTKTSLRGSLSRVPINGGKGKAVLTKNHIQSFRSVDELVGETLYVSVSVLTESGSEMVEAERRGIHIVKAPYTIHFTKTPKFFKPGMPFNFMVYVTNPDGTPAAKVDLKTTQENVKGMTNENGIAKLIINTEKGTSHQDITVQTVGTGINAENKMTALAYMPKDGSQNYLHIDVSSEVLNVGDTVHLKLIFGSSPGVQKQDITYMVLSKGRILDASRLKNPGNSVMAVPLQVTKEMLPSFRVVAYYHVGTSEVVADSVWVDVKDTCMGSLEVKVAEDFKDTTYRPDQEINLEISGNSEAKVHLVAVDKGVYVLNNRNRLNQIKIWDTIEKKDIACTAGSGKDSMGVFYDAGLMFISNSAGSTTARSEFSCPSEQKRKRREITRAQLRETLVSGYSESVRQCCLDGMVKNLLGYTCERRVEYVEDGEECRTAFLKCCKKLAEVKQEQVREELLLARSEDDDVEDDDMQDEIVTRTHFHDSWMWFNVSLPNCGANKICQNEVQSHLPSSITTWVITAVSVSTDNGVCVADPLELKVTKTLFIDLKLPYSAVVNEQIEIKAIIYNLGNLSIKKAVVELKETETICSLASYKKKYQTTVSVARKSSRAIPFIIIPLVPGIRSIKVTVRAPNAELSDGVEKKLNVVGQGVLTSAGEVTLSLEPTQHGGIQKSEIKRPVLKNQMPGTDAFTYIAVRGNPVAQLMNEAISGKGLSTLIRQPTGCGEQNLMAMVLPLIATNYVDKSSQWEDFGVDKRAEWLQHISTGYVNELSFRNSDGSFGLFEKSTGSTWLTAYVVRILSKASNLVSLEENVICDAVKWLILKAQMPDGVFNEVFKISSSAMGGKATQLSMTAFVLLALQEAQPLCNRRVSTFQQSIDKATHFIEQNIASQTDPYAVAMASYALANADKLKLDVLLRFASPDATHWPVKESHFFTLEATGYALLTLLKISDYEKAPPVMKWLKTNQRYGSGSHSTQAIAVGFDAMSKYLTAMPPSTESMNVVVTSTAKGKPFSGLINRKTRGLWRSDRFLADGDLTVTASGNGEGSISVITRYYIKPDENATKCENFDLDVKFIRNKTTSFKNALATYTLSIETKFLKQDSEGRMTILDIGLLTGFVPDISDLQQLMKTDRYIQKFEMDKQLSERGSLIIYLNKVSNKVHERIVFRMHQMLTVALPQPVQIKVYEYYSPEKHCVKFYDTGNRVSGTLHILCPTDVCSCAEANCAQLKGPEVPKEQDRIEESCNQRDYVFKGTLKGLKQVGSTISYTFTIVVLKDGTDLVEPNGEREFLANSQCDKKLNLIVGKDYLIMGPEPQKVKESYRYILGSSTWIEYWPTEEESQGNRVDNRERHIGLATLVHHLKTFGCTT
ncbi:complement C3-like [Salminus brasiliensis]|uniref:complement C3-like n=1 Tax=Salminus brasiliensis TaxID=930266 RepID=UPI003B835CB5